MKKFRLLGYFYSLLLLIALSALPSKALVAPYTFTSSQGTYTEITGGTVHGTGTSMDYSILATAQNIGFTFSYNGGAYTQIGISPDSWVKLGTGITGSSSPISGSAVGQANIISAFSRDLQGNTNGEVRSQLLGTAPERVFVVQYKNFRRYGSSNTSDNLNFQIQLHENGNIVKIVYGTMVSGGSVTGQVGIKGAANTDYNNRTTTTDWAASTAGAANNATMTLSSTVFPPSGLTYEWQLLTPFVGFNPSTVAFNFVPDGTASNAQVVNISGGNLTNAPGNLTLTASENFELWDGNQWTNSIEIPYTGAVLAAVPCSVRFVSPTPAALVNGTLTLTGGGVTENNTLALSGTGILSYCTSNATSTSDQDIGNVTISLGETVLLNNGTATPIYSNPTANKTYSDFTTTVAPIELIGGSTYNISLSVINASTTAYASVIKVYIDYNRNGVFDFPQELAFTVPATKSGAGQTSDTWTGTFTVPYIISQVGNAQARMRIVIDESDVAPSCGTYTWGETEDYTVQFIAPPPFVTTLENNLNFAYVAPSQQSTAQTVTLIAGTLTPDVGNLTVTPSANYEVSLDNGTTWSNSSVQVPYTNGGANLAPNAVQVRFNSPTALGLNFPGTLTVTGANAANPAIVNLFAENMQPYPASSVSATSVIDTLDIAKITLGEFNYGVAEVLPTTGRTEAINKYSDNRLAASIVNLNAGSTYQVTANVFTTGTELPLCSLRVYVDYNANGVFTDANETALTLAIPVANNGVATGTFTVPVDAVIDTTNNPRIRVVLSTSAPSSNSTTYTVGETEDYLVNVGPALPMEYVSTATEQVGKDVIGAGSVIEPIIRTNVVMNNIGNPLTLNSITFNTNGTNQTAAIANANVYYTTTTTFETTTLVGTAIATPNGAMEFTPATSIELSAGNNYFWLTYDVSGIANLDAVLDAELTSLFISDAPTVNKVTTAQAPQGFSLVNKMKFDGTFSGGVQAMPYQGWTNLVVYGTSTSNKWSSVTAGLNPSNAPHSAPSMAHYNANSITSNNVAALISPAFSMDGENEPTSFSLWLYRHQSSTTGAGSRFKVYMNTTPTMTDATLIKPIGYPDADSINVRYNQGLIPEPAIGWYKYSYSIPNTFNGATNYLIFVGTSDYYNNIHLDDIKLGQDAYMAYNTNQVLSVGSEPAVIGGENAVVGAFSVNTIASNNPLTLSNIKFTTEGVTNVADIHNARLWSIGTSTSFNPATAIPVATLATIVSGQNTITAATPFVLAEGNNNFVLTYDVAATATEGNFIDAKLDAFSLGRGTTFIERTFANGNPEGNRLLRAALNGTYTIGGEELANNWYPTLTEAADDISALGINGNVDLALAADQLFTANNAPVFTAFNSMGGDYTLTIYPKDEARTITGSYAGTAMGVLTFIGTDRIVIDGRINKAGENNSLTIINNAEGPCVAMGYNATYGSVNTATVRNTNFKGMTATNSTSAFGIRVVGNDNSDIVIVNNKFDRISNGIEIAGTSTNKISSVAIYNNTFGSPNEADRLRRFGVKLSNTDEVLINKNTFNGLGSIDGLSISNIAAIDLGEGVTDADIINNNITDLANYNTSGYGAYGVNISSNTGVSDINIVANQISNFICDGDGISTTYSPFGIRLNGGTNIKVYHNTVNFEGQYSGDEQGASACFAITSTGTSVPTNLDLRNNIFRNTLTNADVTSKSWAIYAPAAYVFTTIDYNNYTVEGPRGVLAYYGADKTTLAAWKTSVAADVNSVNSTVSFLSNSDLHLSGASALNRSLLCPALADVTLDIDGLTRRTEQMTQMGVDEAYATITLDEQAPATVTACIQLGETNQVQVPSGTVSTLGFDDEIERTIDNSKLQYIWVKNGTETLAATTTSLTIEYTAIPEVADTYKATIVSLFAEVEFATSTLNLTAKPSKFALSGAATLCPNATVGTDFTLADSEEGISYQLMLATEAIGTPQIGTGEALNFTNITRIGTYTVVATNLATNCSSTMTGTAVITSQPTATQYNVIGGGEYCEANVQSFELKLSDSQTGVTYQLFNGTTAVGTPVAGTDNELILGQFSEPGTYTVVANNSICSTEMLGSATIIRTSVPTEFAITGGGNVCVNTTLGLASSELGVEYQLFRNSVAVPNSVIIGTGDAITFPQVSTNGTYSVTAYSGSCTKEFTNTVNVIVKPNPTVVNLLVNTANTSTATVCENSAVTFGLSATENGTVYTLFNGDDAVLTPITGNGNAMNFAVITAELSGVYHVVANKNGCTRTMNNEVTLTVNPNPMVYTVSGGGELCQGENTTLAINLSGSEVGTEYQLFRNAVPFGQRISGTGSALMLGTDNMNGTFTAKAYKNNCSIDMDGSAIITVKPLPQLFNIASAGSTSCSSTGLELLLNDSEVGTDYTLMLDGEVVLNNTLAGTGEQLSYGIHSAEGVYTIVANRNNCIRNMQGSINLRIAPPPTSFDLVGGGAICTGDAGLMLTLSGSQIDGLYQVRLNGEDLGQPVEGTDAALTFGPFTQPGTYSVLAEKGGCETIMNGTPIITVNPKPTVAITGNTQALKNETETYTANAENGVAYLWTVTGGTISGADNQASVNITWGAAGTGTVTLTKTYTQTQCAASISQDVTILNLVAPSVQAKNIIFSSVTQNSMLVRWTRGNGNGVMLVAYPGNSVTAIPTLGATYNVGDQIGSGFVVYKGSATSCNVTGLTAGTNYTFKAYAYNNDGPVYNVKNASLNPRTKNTAIGGPTNLTLEEIGTDFAVVEWDYTGNSEHFELQVAFDNAFTQIVPGYDNADFGNEQVAILEDLTSKTNYFVKVRAFYGTSVSPWSQVLAFTTTMAEPEDEPADVLVSERTLNSYKVAWTPGSGANSIVLVSKNAINTAPEDNETYTFNSNFTTANTLIGGAKVVYVGNASEFVLSGLEAETQYNIAVYTFDGENGTENYLATPATAVGATLHNEPDFPPTAMLFTDRTDNSMKINWTAGSSQGFMLLANTVNEFEAPVDGTSYTEGEVLGTAQIVSIDAANNTTYVELTADTKYYYQVFGFNGAEGTENYLPVALAGNAKTMAELAVAPTEINVTVRTHNTLTLTWNEGTDASNYIILASTEPIAAIPANATAYTANSNFTTAPALSGAKVVYNGNGLTQQITGFAAADQYYFRVFAYNGSNTSEVYSTTFSEVDAWTLSTEPIAPTALVAKNATVNTIDLEWTNAAKSVVMMNTTGNFTAPVDGELASLGNNNVVYVGDMNTFTAHGLTAGITYHFAVYSFNGENGTQNYNATAATTSDATLPTEPTAVTALTVGEFTNTTVNLSWTKGNGTNTIILASEDEIEVAPVDGEEYELADVLEYGEDQFATVVYMGADATATISGLDANTTYHFAAFAYNGAGTKTNFNTTAAEAEATTLEFAPATKLAVIAPETLTNGTPFNVTVESQTADGVATPSTVARLITLTQVGNNGSLFGTLTATIPAGSSSITFNGLVFYANNGASQLVLNAATTGLTAGTATIAIPVAAPTQQDKLILFSNVTNLGMTVKWTAGNGSHRVLVMKAGSAPTAAPVNGTVYSVDAANTTLSDGSIVKHVGTATTANITELAAGTTYHFKAFNYNTPANPVYCTAPGSFNPRSRTAVAKGEVAPQDELTEADINNNSFFVGSINPNPVVNNINFKMTNHEEMVMNISVFDASGREVAKLANGELMTIGTHNFNYSLSNDLSSGTYLLVVTAGDQTAVQTFSIVK